MRLRWIVPWLSLGCAPACGDDSRPAEPSPTTSTSTGGLTPSSSSSSSSTSGAAAPTGADATSLGDPDGVGACRAVCDESTECGTSGSGGPVPVCERGFCELDAEPTACNPVECEVLYFGVCADVDGVSTCTVPCTFGSNECAFLMQECIGRNDEGAFICAPLPCDGVAEGEPCATLDGRSYGTCIDGDCTCAVDEECTQPGFACRR